MPSGATAFIHVGDPLTPRELGVLLRLADGENTMQIAAELEISPETVRTYVARILVKLDAHTRAQAVAHAYHAHILIAS